MVNFIHDETINEIPITTPKEITERVDGIKETMEKSMRKVVPDVKIVAEPTLMDRWYKEAEELRDEQGYLKIWSAKEQ